MKSQASQDAFALGVLSRIKDFKPGFYLEIGAGHPVEWNNTYEMEQRNWRGISIDILDHAALWAERRRNTFLSTDACNLDYDQLLQAHNAPGLINYLSIDIDARTNEVLRRIPFDLYEFDVITCEHDFYQHGDRLRTEQREILSSYGYIRVCSDVNGPEWPFEDWWLNRSLQNWLNLPLLENVHHDEIIKTYGFPHD